MIVPLERAESHDVGAQHRAVLSRERAQALRSGEPRGTDGLKRQADRKPVPRAPRQLLGEPAVNLPFDDVKDTRGRVDEAGEVLRAHYERADRTKRRNGGRPDIDPQGATLSPQLPRPALRDDPGAAILLQGNLRPAAENDNYVVRGRAFLHKPGTAEEGALLGNGNKGQPLGRIERIQEIHAT